MIDHIYYCIYQYQQRLCLFLLIHKNDSQSSPQIESMRVFPLVMGALHATKKLVVLFTEHQRCRLLFRRRIDE